MQGGRCQPYKAHGPFFQQPRIPLFTAGGKHGLGRILDSTLDAECVVWIQCTELFVQGLDAAFYDTVAQALQLPGREGRFIRGDTERYGAQRLVSRNAVWVGRRSNVFRQQPTPALRPAPWVDSGRRSRGTT